MTTTRWVPAALALALAVASCGKRQPEGGPGSASPTGSPPGVRVDVAADTVLQALRPGLEAWVERWKAAIPGFTLDSLYREAGSGLAMVDRRAADRDDLRRARTFGALSPDSTRIAEPDSYRQLVDGAWELWGEPDSAPALLDLRADSLSILTVVGPAGGFEEAFWVDGDRFAITGYGERRFRPWTGGGDLWVCDLARGTLTYYHTPDVDSTAFGRYMDRMRPELQRRYNPRLRV